MPSHLFRGPPEAVAEAVRHNGLGCVQLTPNFPDLPFHHPGQFSRDRCRQAADPFLARGIRIACLTGSSDLLDPDLDRRHRGVLRLHALLRHGREFGTDHVVAETGGAGGEAARAELRLIVAEALRVAADAGVRLLLKPAATQALASAADAVRLAEELADPRLGFVIDPAGLLADQEPAAWDAALERLFAQLGPRAPVLHAKDLGHVGGSPLLPRAGLGGLDYARIARLWRHYQPGGPVILQHVCPEEVPAARAYLERFFQE